MMADQLKRLYFAYLVPAVAGFAIVYVIRNVGPPINVPDSILVLLSRLLFILSAVIALACPILHRCWFAHCQRNSMAVPQVLLIRFQRHLIRTIMIVPYLALAAYSLPAQRFYLAGTLLITLYAVYYYYPSEKRIRFDERMFRSTPS
jgi:hypothetical protein